MKLGTDGKIATLDIQGEFTTTQVETLITRLGGIRANMAPPVSDQIPMPDTEGLEVSVQSDPALALERRRDGTFRFWLRNLGLGWLVFVLDEEKAIAIRDYLVANTPDQDGRPTLFGQKLGDGDTPH